MRLITPELKDVVLRAILAENKEAFKLRYLDVFPNKEISKGQFELILLQFKKMGLLEEARNDLGYFYISVIADIYDYFIHGGFIAQEELLRSNIQKLDYELTKLVKDINPGISDRIVKITGIVSSLTTALGLFK